MAEGREEKKFQYDERGKCPEYGSYIKGMSTDGNPFDCIYLRVLHENHTISEYGGKHPQKLKIGHLVCAGKVDNTYPSKHCTGLQKPRINEDGDLETICDSLPNKKMIIKLEK